MLVIVDFAVVVARGIGCGGHDLNNESESEREVGEILDRRTHLYLSSPSIRITSSRGRPLRVTHF